ncbi:histone-lysine N-methyltransferase SETDB1-A-like isoform X3 [Melanotaenia boesemani]|uniref:histone-lysine N-methyltransferase SETDB1-A-like isoform X3 n=1 Tax=Melanotaenia boesemani TaxID=1250792 RepID=UPI001C041F77|nr:histone-lysine N-methyltransferase SETDB1-A-like isoform X3 [Melanotaenia boesemani]
MEEDEMEMSKEELKTWIRDQVENTRLTSPGLLEKYNLLHSLLKRREKQASNFLKLCQSVAACEEIVKELYAFLEWEYKDSDSDDESTGSGCTVQLQSKQHFHNCATSNSSDSQLSKSKAKEIKKTGHPILNRKAVVVLTRLRRSQIIRAVRRPRPQFNFRENESLSGPESDMQWQPGDEPSDSDSSLSDFNTGSKKRRKIQQKSKTRERSPPASGGSGKFAAVIDGAKTRRLTARKRISTPIKKTLTPHTSSNTDVNGKTAETIPQVRTRKTTTPEANTIKTKKPEANAVQTITCEANATTKTCEANATKTKTSEANSTKTKTSEPNATKTKTSEPNATKTKTSGANSTKTKTSEPNATKTKTSEPNATKTKTSEPNATKTKTSEANAMTTKTSEPNATKTKTSEPNATKTKTSEPNATKTKTSEPNATKTKTSEPNATKTKTSEPNATKTKTSGANSTKTKTSEPNATKTKTSEPNATKTSESNAMKTKTSEPNATKTKTSGANSTKTKTSESNATKTKTSGANAPKTKTSEANATTKTCEANTKASAERKEATTSTPSAETTVNPLNQGATLCIRTAPIMPPGEVTMNMKVLARKKELSWQLGTIKEIITKDDGRLKYKVIFEKGKSLVSGHHIAFEYSPTAEQLFIGARVVVKYTAEKPEFMPGIMAELPNRKNRMRFLVFIDNHTPVYVGLPLLRLVCKPLADPLNDITEQTHQSYMREYLKHWPHPPQTQYRVGQPVKVEHNGTLQRCEVVSIDCSLMEVSFKSDQHKEWLYRGSIRLYHMSDLRQKMVSNKDDEMNSKPTSLKGSSKATP